MTTPDAPDLPLTPGAIRVLQELGPRPGVGVNDWLLLFLDRFGPMVGALAPGLDLAGTKASLRQSVTGGNNGAALDADRLTQEARAIARGLGKAQVAERDLVAAALRAAGHVVTYQLGVASPPRKPDTEPAGKAPGDPSPPAAPLAGIRTLSPTPTLERFGRDLTQAARDGVLPSCVGRDTEIETIIETLCRRTKRNPLLVGAAGTGKTAIVEGIARRIAQDQVPAPLRGVRLFGLQPSALVAGAGIVGELDKRVGAILAEAKQDGIVLFIDEVHAIMGAGGREGTGDISSMLKPALARGEIACIAATTDEEYRQFIEHDRALERRFQPIRIQELSPERTLEVLKVVRDDLVRGRGLEVGDEVLTWLVDVARQFMPNRHFPDKAVDLLDQTVANGVSRALTRITRVEAEAVVKRMLGIPSLERTRLDTLRARLVDQQLLDGFAADRLVARLEVTSRGLDLRAARPNAVLALQGPMHDRALLLSEAIAEGLYGDPRRVVRIDFARFQDDASITALLGSPAGYVGYEDRHALYAVAEMPWSVVLCDRIDRCHPAVLAAFTPAITQGMITDFRGRRIYLSDAVVIFTLGGEQGREIATIGFAAQDRGPDRDEPADAEDLEERLGPELAATVDFTFSEAPQAVSLGSEWITARLLPDVAARHREHGVTLEWDASIVTWLAGAWSANASAREVEQLVEHEISPALVRALYQGSSPVPSRYVVKRQQANLVVERIP